MANHPSASKRARQTKKREARNKSQRTALRSKLKVARVALAAGDVQDAQGKVSGAAVALAKATTKGLVHKNTAARTTSRLYSALNQLSS